MTNHHIDPNELEAALKRTALYKQTGRLPTVGPKLAAKIIAVHRACP